MAKSSLSMEYILLAKCVHCAHFIDEETEDQKRLAGDFPGSPVVTTSPSAAGGAVLFLVSELKSHMNGGRKIKT